MSRKKSTKLIGIDGLSPAERHHYRHYYNRAKKRQLAWKLSTTLFKQLIYGSCFYCGCQPKIRNIAGKYKVRLNGVDRVDSSLGYLVDNVVSCCRWCNNSKSVLSTREWLQHVAKVARHQKLIVGIS